MARTSNLRSTIGNLVLLGASLVVAGLIAELVVRFFYPADRLEYEADDELLWRFRPNQVGWVDVDGPMRRSPPATINSLGFRGPEFDPTRGGTRVLALGDSFTFGSGVADDETFCQQIERISGGEFTVINAGMQGWGVFQMQIQLRKALEIVRPKFVLVTIIEDDLNRQPPDPASARSGVRLQRIKTTIRSYSRLITITWRLVERTYLKWSNRATLNALSQTTEEPGDNPAGAEAEGPSPVFRKLWDLDHARLLEMRDRAATGGARLIVAGWPQKSRNTTYFLAQIVALNKEGVIGIDLSRSLGGYRWSKFSIPGDGHPTPLGHETAARQILLELQAAQPR